MGRVQLLTCGIVSKVEQLQTNKTYMNKDFEVGSFLKQDDYTTYNQMGLILTAGLCAIVLFVAFVVPLIG
jgi:hypothetical protein